MGGAGEVDHPPNGIRNRCPGDVPAAERGHVTLPVVGYQMATDVPIRPQRLDGSMSRSGGVPSLSNSPPQVPTGSRKAIAYAAQNLTTLPWRGPSPWRRVHPYALPRSPLQEKTARDGRPSRRPPAAGPECLMRLRPACGRSRWVGVARPRRSRLASRLQRWGGLRCACEELDHGQGDEESHGQADDDFLPVGSSQTPGRGCAR